MSAEIARNNKNLSLQSVLNFVLVFSSYIIKLIRFETSFIIVAMIELET